MDFDDQNDFQATNIKIDENGTTFDVHVRDDYYRSFQIPTFGKHNVLNALSVVALCHYENLSGDVVAAQLANFKGVKRRFTEKVVDGQVLIDDYAHHPTEIRATIESAHQKYPNREVVAIFQPHTFTRTKTFLNEFADVLKEADVVYLCDIFGSAREDVGQLSIDQLIDKIPNAHLISEQSIQQLNEHDSGVLLFMGAGDIQKYQEAYEAEKASI